MQQIHQINLTLTQGIGSHKLSFAANRYSPSSSCSTRARALAYVLGSLLAVVTMVSASVAHAGDNIDVAISETVPLLLAKLKEQNLKTVGVLPFRLKQSGKEELAGALIQTNMALRIEQAMAVYRDPDQPVNVAFGTLNQARKSIPDAEFLTSKGRKKLFDVSYELPVGETKAKLDGFVTGVVEVSPDWRTTKIYFEYCLASNPAKLNKSGPFDIKTDRKMLVSMGKGFTTPKQLASRSITTALVMEGVQNDIDFQLQEDKKADIKSPEQRVGRPISTNPFQSAPVTLKVKYDNQDQVLTQDEFGGKGNATIVDPKAGQKVTFELTNNTDKKVGVVLAINGKSLLYDEYTVNPDEASKFVLDPRRTYSVAGVYQRDHKGIQPVVGLSDSQTSEITKAIPSEAAGLIHMYVYQESAGRSSGSGSTGSGSTGGGSTGSGSTGSGSTGSGSTGSGSTDGGSTGGGSTGGGSTGTGTESGNVFYLRDEIETFQDGFSFGYARDAGGKKVQAMGSFSPTGTIGKAKTWDDLADNIAKNIVTPSSTSRGLMVGQGGVESQAIQSSEIGTVQQTDTFIIRYLSIAK